MSEKFLRLKRTDMCGTISEKHLNKEVVVSGWVQDRRDLGSIIFITLRDRAGIVQIYFDQNENKELFDIADSVRSEYVMSIKGFVRERSGGNFNTEIPTGRYEIVANDVQVLSRAQTPPFEIDDKADVNDQLRLKYRYLDLRRPGQADGLVMRHRITKIARDFYDENGFLEIETPILQKSTPEGARDYLVPSRVHHGKFYALPQSPQLYKQILMVSGMDRYFQIAKCFRDEDLRADRQPEFTQIDLEMSFVDVDDVITLNERFVRRVFKEVLNVDLPEHFDRVTYREAMERYGSDKPDRRFGMELKNLSNIFENSEFKAFSDVVKSGGSVRAINAKNAADKLSRRELDKLVDFVKTYKAKGLAWVIVEDGEIKSSIKKFLSEDDIKAITNIMDASAGDVVLLVADKDKIVFDSLGALRCELAKRFGLINNKEFDFLWVTEFPLLEYSEEEERYVAMHHPFTSPMDEDVKLLDTDPGLARAKAYDIVLNGCELGGGSIRIHDSELQKKMFKVIGLSEEDANVRFGFLIEAFKYGTPPHGGMAYGLDRMVMLMSGKSSIRDVIAFPKVQNASELMSNAPDTVDENQLKDLGIEISKTEEQ